MSDSIIVPVIGLGCVILLEVGVDRLCASMRKEMRAELKRAATESALTPAQTVLHKSLQREVDSLEEAYCRTRPFEILLYISQLILMGIGIATYLAHKRKRQQHLLIR